MSEAKEVGFKYYLETIKSWEPTPDDRTAYKFESGYNATGRPIYTEPIGKKALWITVNNGQNPDNENTVGIFAANIDGDKIMLDIADRVSPVIESNVARVRSYWEQLPKEINLSEVIVPSAYNPKTDS